ncbi:hypothetical protein B6I21_08840, partial [candidate division KSB1 bacterium 4572_119]
PSVARVAINLEKRTVGVEGDVRVEQIVNAVREAGFSPEVDKNY